MKIPVFDFDGTLVDSDEALIAPFLALGIPAAAVGQGRLLAEECAAHGVTVEDYQAHYDLSAVQPFPGVEELLAGLDRWGLCSNKHPDAGAAELQRLGWQPTASTFALGAPKSLPPVLEQLGVSGEDVLFVGDTDHDRECAQEVGATFVVAGWNRRCVVEAGDLVARDPREILDFLRD